MHGSYHVLLPHFEISQVSERKTSITLLFFISLKPHQHLHRGLCQCSSDKDTKIFEINVVFKKKIERKNFLT